MKEEQKKKCEEIYKLYELNYRNSGIIKEVAKFILIYCGIMPLFYLDRYGSRWIKIAMLLAKVFNMDITKKEAKEKVFADVRNEQSTIQNKVDTLRDRLENWDVYKAIETPINHNDNKSKYLKPSYTYKGYTNSLRQICKHFNLNYGAIKYSVIRGMSVKDACDKGTEKPYTYVKRVSNLGGKHFDKH